MATLLESLKQDCLRMLEILGILRAKQDLPVNLPIAPSSPPIPTVINTSKLEKFCLAIRDFEGRPPKGDFKGDKNWRNNNPGNCRYSKVGYLPIYQPVRKDKDGFAIFKDYPTGWLYLQNLVKHKVAKNPNQTLFQFISIYAPVEDANEPKVYATYIAKRLGVTIDTPMKDLV